MISLPGLCLATGRHDEAATILRSFARFVRDGLLPNNFPDRAGVEPEYHTIDASLWYPLAVRAHAVATASTALVDELLPTLRSILDAHLAGTRFGIGMDPSDGLLRGGADGYQLTWMDARVDGWVVTPRRGKPVEIQALWTNALRIVGGWLVERGDPDGAGARLSRTSPIVPRRRSSAGSGDPSSATLPTSSTVLTATTWRFDPTRCSRCRSPTRSSTARWPRPCSTPWVAALAVPLGPPLARAERSRLPTAVPGRPSLPRRGLPPGNGLDLADRPVRRGGRPGPRTTPRPGSRSSGPSRTTCARRAWAPSPRSWNPSRRSNRAAARSRPGAWPRCYGSGGRSAAADRAVRRRLTPTAQSATGPDDRVAGRASAGCEPARRADGRQGRERGAVPGPRPSRAPCSPGSLHGHTVGPLG